MRKLTNQNIRFIPTLREALDGKLWWCVYDTKRKEFCRLFCFGKYKTRKACQSQIDFCLEYHPEYFYRY